MYLHVLCIFVTRMNIHMLSCYRQRCPSVTLRESRVGILKKQTRVFDAPDKLIEVEIQQLCFPLQNDKRQVPMLVNTVLPPHFLQLYLVHLRSDYSSIFSLTV